MTWTYGNDPANDTTDEVRLLIGDTDTNDQLLSDEEIAYYLADFSSVKAAAAAAARAVSASFARQASDKKIGSLSIQLSKRAEHYERLASSLDRKAAAARSTILAGGLTKSGKRDLASDTDAEQPVFSVGGYDSERTARRRGSPTWWGD